MSRPSGSSTSFNYKKSGTGTNGGSGRKPGSFSKKTQGPTLHAPAPIFLASETSTSKQHDSNNASDSSSSSHFTSGGKGTSGSVWGNPHSFAASSHHTNSSDSSSRGNSTNTGSPYTASKPSGSAQTSSKPGTSDENHSRSHSHMNGSSPYGSGASSHYNSRQGSGPSNRPGLSRDEEFPALGSAPLPSNASSSSLSAPTVSSPATNYKSVPSSHSSYGNSDDHASQGSWRSNYSPYRHGSSSPFESGSSSGYGFGHYGSHGGGSGYGSSGASWHSRKESYHTRELPAQPRYPGGSSQPPIVSTSKLAITSTPMSSSTTSPSTQQSHVSYSVLNKPSVTSTPSQHQSPTNASTQTHIHHNQHVKSPSITQRPASNAGTPTADKTHSATTTPATIISADGAHKTKSEVVRKPERSDWAALDDDLPITPSKPPVAVQTTQPPSSSDSNNNSNIIMKNNNLNNNISNKPLSDQSTITSDVQKRPPLTQVPRVMTKPSPPSAAKQSPQKNEQEERIAEQKRLAEEKRIREEKQKVEEQERQRKEREKIANQKQFMAQQAQQKAKEIEEKDRLEKAEQDKRIAERLKELDEKKKAKGPISDQHTEQLKHRLKQEAEEQEQFKMQQRKTQFGMRDPIPASSQPPALKSSSEAPKIVKRAADSIAEPTPSKAMSGIAIPAAPSTPAWGTKSTPSPSKFSQIMHDEQQQANAPAKRSASQYDQDPDDRAGRTSKSKARPGHRDEAPNPHQRHYDSSKFKEREKEFSPRGKYSQERGQSKFQQHKEQQFDSRPQHGEHFQPHFDKQQRNERSKPHQFDKGAQTRRGNQQEFAQLYGPSVDHRTSDDHKVFHPKEHHVSQPPHHNARDAAGTSHTTGAPPQQHRPKFRPKQPSEEPGAVLTAPFAAGSPALAVDVLKTVAAPSAAAPAELNPPTEVKSPKFQKSKDGKKQKYVPKASIEPQVPVESQPPVAKPTASHKPKFVPKQQQPAAEQKPAEPVAVETKIEPQQPAIKAPQLEKTTTPKASELAVPAESPVSAPAQSSNKPPARTAIQNNGKKSAKVPKFQPKAQVQAAAPSGAAPSEPATKSQQPVSLVAKEHASNATQSNGESVAPVAANTPSQKGKKPREPKKPKQTTSTTSSPSPPATEQAKLSESLKLSPLEASSSTQANASEVPLSNAAPSAQSKKKYQKKEARATGNSQQANSNAAKESAEAPKPIAPEQGKTNAEQSASVSPIPQQAPTPSSPIHLSGNRISSPIPANNNVRPTRADISENWKKDKVNRPASTASTPPPTTASPSPSNAIPMASEPQQQTEQKQDSALASTDACPTSQNVPVSEPTLGPTNSAPFQQKPRSGLNQKPPREQRPAKVQVRQYVPKTAPLTAESAAAPSESNQPAPAPPVPTAEALPSSPQQPHDNDVPHAEKNHGPSHSNRHSHKSFAPKRGGHRNVGQPTYRPKSEQH